MNPIATRSSSSALTLAPDGALGWRVGIMDGLNCTQRCIEALLREAGRSPLQIALALAQPLDMLHCDGPDWSWPGCRLDWDSSDDPASNWLKLSSLLRQGRTPFAMIDRWYWPGDEYQGKRHIQSYVVLVLQGHDRELLALGVHGDPEDGYRHRVRLDPESQPALWRVGTLELEPAIEPSSLHERCQTLVDASLEPLARDLASLRAFAAAWSSRPPEPLVAWPLTTMVFADLEPQTFLLGVALEATSDDRLVLLGQAAGRAAAIALRLGFLLLEANRTGQTAAYDFSRGLLDTFVDRLDDLLSGLSHLAGRQPPAGPPRIEPVLARLRDIAALCYGRQFGAAASLDGYRDWLDPGSGARV